MAHSKRSSKEPAQSPNANLPSNLIGRALKDTLSHKWRTAKEKAKRVVEKCASSPLNSSSAWNLKGSRRSYGSETRTTPCSNSTIASSGSVSTGIPVIIIDRLGPSTFDRIRIDVERTYSQSGMDLVSTPNTTSTSLEPSSIHPTPGGPYTKHHTIQAHEPSPSRVGTGRTGFRHTTACPPYNHTSSSRHFPSTIRKSHPEKGMNPGGLETIRESSKVEPRPKQYSVSTITSASTTSSSIHFPTSRSQPRSRSRQKIRPRAVDFSDSDNSGLSHLSKPNDEDHMASGSGSRPLHRMDAGAQAHMTHGPNPSHIRTVPRPRRPALFCPSPPIIAALEKQKGIQVEVMNTLDGDAVDLSQSRASDLSFPDASKRNEKEVGESDGFEVGAGVIEPSPISSSESGFGDPLPRLGVIGAGMGSDFEECSMSMTTVDSTMSCDYTPRKLWRETSVYQELPLPRIRYPSPSKEWLAYADGASSSVRRDVDAVSLPEDASDVSFEPRFCPRPLQLTSSPDSHKPSRRPTLAAASNPTYRRGIVFAQIPLDTPQKPWPRGPPPGVPPVQLDKRMHTYRRMPCPVLGGLDAGLAREYSKSPPLPPLPTGPPMMPLPALPSQARGLPIRRGPAMLPRVRIVESEDSTNSCHDSASDRGHCLSTGVPRVSESSYPGPSVISSDRTHGTEIRLAGGMAVGRVAPSPRSAKVRSMLGALTAKDGGDVWVGKLFELQRLCEAQPRA